MLARRSLKSLTTSVEQTCFQKGMKMRLFLLLRTQFLLRQGTCPPRLPNCCIPAPLARGLGRMAGALTMRGEQLTLGNPGKALEGAKNEAPLL